MSVDDKLLDQKEDEIEEEKEEDSEKSTDSDANGSGDNPDDDSGQDKASNSYKVGEESSSKKKGEDKIAPKEKVPEIKKSKFDTLNDETRKNIEKTKSEDLEGLRILHNIFHDYVIGEEIKFLVTDKAENKDPKKKKMKDKKSKGKKDEKSSEDTTEKVDEESNDEPAKDNADASPEELKQGDDESSENPIAAAISLEADLADFTNGQGIAGAAIEAIRLSEEAYGTAAKEEPEEAKDSNDENASEGEPEKSGNANDEKAAKFNSIVDIFDGYGDTALSIIGLIPGFDIVVSAIKAITNARKAHKANENRVKMNDYRRLFKEKYVKKSFEVDKKGDNKSDNASDDKAADKKASKPNTKSMVQKSSRLKFWKKTDLTVDQKTMSERLEQLKSEPVQDADVKEEIQDIQKFLIEDKLRKVNRNSRAISGAKMVLSIIPLLGGLNDLISKYGGNISGKNLIKHAGSKSKEEYAKDAAKLSALEAGTKVIKKTREDKAKASDYTNHLLEIIAGLPDSYQDLADKFKYVETKDIIDSTGVNSKKLLRIANYVQTASKADNKNKGLAEAYKMFIEKFK